MNDDGVDPGIDDKGPPNDYEGPPNKHNGTGRPYEEEIAGVEAIMEELEENEDHDVDEAMEDQEARIAGAGNGGVPTVKQDDPGARPGGS